MRLSLKMVDKTDYGIAATATLFAWVASNPVGVWLALHPFAKTLLQGLLTIGLGLGAVTVQHFWRRWLRTRWPDPDSME